VIIVSCTKNIFCWGEGMLQQQGTVTHGNGEKVYVLNPVASNPFVLEISNIPKFGNV